MPLDRHSYHRTSETTITSFDTSFDTEANLPLELELLSEAILESHVHSVLRMRTLNVQV